MEQPGNGNAINLTLRDGGKLWLRPILPEDRDRIKRGMLLLSAESRYLRFFSPIVKLSEKQLREFTEVDQVNHIAWIAINPDHLDHPGYGVARFVRLADQPTKAELAITVLDEHQNKGVGTIFLALMYLLAIEQGLTALLGAMVPENMRLVEWVTAIGAQAKYEEGVYRIELPVYKDYAVKLNPKSGKVFIKLLDEIAPYIFDKAIPA